MIASGAAIRSAIPEDKHMARVTLNELNAAFDADFVLALDGIYEHAPFVAEAAAPHRPYPTVAALHEALMGAVRARSVEERIAFVRNHPDLAGKAARAGDMAPASVSEQAGLGLDRLSDEEYTRFERLNAAHRERFGFPFIVCVRRLTRDAVLDAFERRLANDPATELATALDEIGYITRLRLVEKVDGPGLPQVFGRLSTHVLDTHRGGPAEGVRLALYQVARSGRTKLGEAVTNADGRTDTPLLSSAPLRIGVYELVFEVGDYFARRGLDLPGQPFLGEVPLRFGISEPEGHYHVPLLVTPWSFSTYRGS
jgi:2-oxo-4-hydroxy-4-carboxy-5-ureidoimidazoline decarboxylase